MNSNGRRDETPPEERGRLMVDTTMTTKRCDRCCCNLLHVTTATLLIGCLELCYFAYEVFSTAYHFMKTGEQYALSLSISLFGIILAVIAVILLFAAVRTSTPYLLVPHLLMQVAAICVLSLMSLFCIFALTAGTSLDFRIVNVEDSPAGDLALNTVGSPAYELTYISKALALLLSFICVTLLALALLQVWMLMVVLRCFFHLQKKALLKAQPTVPAMDITEIDRIPAVNKVTQNTTNDTENNNCFPFKMNSSNNSRTRVETDC